MPYADLHPDKPGKIRLTTGYEDRYLVKQLPGAQYDTSTRTWHAPLTWGTCIIARGLFRESLTLSEDLAEWGWVERTERVAPAIALRTSIKPSSSFEDDKDLFEFQRAGIEFLLAAKSAILADEMGSGKTVQMIRTLQKLERPYPALVACPNSVKKAWFKEFARWAPEVRVQLVHGSAAARREQLAEPADVYVMNWESLRLHSRLAGYGAYALKDDEKIDKELNHIQFRTVIGDELHRIKSPHSKQTRAAWYLSRHAKYRYGLTGTPIANKPDEFWSLLHFICPEEWPSKTRFSDRFLEVQLNFWGGREVLGLKAENKTEFFKIVDPRLRRMPKSITMPQLPPMVFQEREAEMSVKQTRAYRQMEKLLLAEFEDGQILTADNPLVKAKRLMQFASSYAQVDENGRAILGDPSNKIDALEELLEDLEDEQIVVFAESRQLIELVARRLDARKKIDQVSYAMVTGRVSALDRQDVVDEFQQGNKRLILATMAAGGTGLTMTAAKYMIRLQRSWNMIDNLQAANRIHRIGSEIHESITVIDLVAPGTIEERQQEALEGKLGNLQQIVRDKEVMRYILLGNK